MLKHIVRYSYVNLFTSLISFALLPFYTAYLSPEDFGMIAIFLLFGPLLCNFFSLGLSQASLRYYYEFKKNNKQEEFNFLHSSNFLFILLVFFIIYLFVFNFSKDLSFFFFKDISFDFLITKSYLYGVILYYINYFYQLFIAQENSKTYSIFYFFNIIFSHVFSIFFILTLDLTFDGRINGLIISNIIILFVSIYINKKLFTGFINLNLVIKSLKFSYPNIPNSFIAIFSMSIDKILLAKISSISSLGILDIANRFGNLSKTTIDLIGKGWTPYFMNKISEDNIENEKVLINYQNIVVIFSLLCLGLVAFSLELVYFLTSEQFHSAYLLVQLIVINYLITQSVTIISLNQIFYAKKLKYTTVVSFVNLVVNTILCLILIPKYNIYGVVFSLILSGIISSIFYFYFAQKAMYLNINLKNIFLTFILFITFSLFVYFLDNFELKFWVTIFLKILIIFLYMYFLKKFFKFNTYEEIKYLIKNYVKKF